MAHNTERRLLPHMTQNKVMNTIVFVIIACIPLLYAGLLSSAYQDPVERVSNMRAAVINQDQSYTAELASGDSKTFAIGDQLEQRLTEPDEGQDVGFTWETMTLEDAQSELKSGNIRAYLVIPETFSRTAGNLGTDDAGNVEKVKIDIVSDDSVSYLAGTMVRTVAATLQGQLSAQAADQYIETVLVSMSTIQEGMTDAADGGQQLTDGSQELETGLTTLADAIGQARDGSSELLTGSTKLADGSQELADGSSTLASGASELAAGTSALNKAIPTLASGASSLSDGATSIDAGSQKISSGAHTLDDAVDQYTTGVDTLAKGINTLAQSSESLITGAGALSDGAAKISAGLGSLDESAGTFDTKMGELAASQTQLATLGTQAATGLSGLAAQCVSAGAAQAFCDNLTQVAQSQAQLATNYEKVAQSTETLGGYATTIATSIGTLSEGATALDAGTSDLVEKVGGVKDTAADKTVAGAVNSLNSGAQQLTANSKSLRDGAHTLATGSNELASGTKTLAAGASTLNGKVPTLTDSVTALDKGANKLANGATDLAGGATTLASGAGELAEGTATLNSGLNEINAGTGSAVAGATALTEGANTLTDALADGSERIPNYAPDDQINIAETASAIADVQSVRNNAVANAAGGFLPMFLALSLWIGGIALFLVLPALDRRNSTAEKWWASALRPMGIAMVIGIAQATLSVLLINTLVEVKAAQLAGWVGIAVLSSLAFVAINQACVAILSYRGRFVSLILLLLQITSMGGTFPVETAPRFFQWLHPLLPMTWTHYGFRAMIAGGGLTGAISRAVITLLVWLVVSLIIVMVCAKLRAGKRPLAHDNANIGDTIDMTEAPFGAEPLPVDSVDDTNAVDATVDLVLGKHA